MMVVNAGSISGLVESAPDFAPLTELDLTQPIGDAGGWEESFESLQA
jgi:hypothetical protein